MKKKQNKPLGVSALQVTLALSLMSLSAVLFASSFKASPSSGGGSGRGYVVVNPAVSGGPETDAPKPAAVLPEINLPALPDIPATPERKVPGLIQSSSRARGQIQAPSYPVQFDPLEWAPVPQARPRAPRVTCTSMASGNWSNPAIWSCGIVPTAADTAIIGDGTFVTIDTAAVALNVTVGQGFAGVLQYDPAVAQSLTLSGNLIVSPGGIFQANPAGSVAAHTLSLPGHVANSGTIDFSQNANTSQVAITFTGASSTSWTGNGNTNLKAVTGVTLNKGTSNASTLEFTPGIGTFTVEGANTAGFLGISNGTFLIDGSNAFTNPVFAAVAYTIPATGGFWLNNSNANILGQLGSPTNNGLLRLSAGTFSIGTIGTHVMGAGAGANFVIEGGMMRVAGRLTSANAVTYTQSGGSVFICMSGGCTTSPSFGFTSTLPTNVFNMSGGTIFMVNSNTLTTADWNQQGRVDAAGGTVQFGSTATTTNFAFRMQGNAPNVVVDNAVNNKTLFLSATSWVYGNVTIPTGATLRLNNLILNMLGSTFTNNGVVTDGLGGGLTAVGRTTISALKMNRAAMIRVRRMWVAMAEHPPDLD